MVAELGDGKARGRGECVPYARYGESVESVLAQIEAMRPRLAAGLDREALQNAMPPGAARNALDCAFWDLEAKQAAAGPCTNSPACPPRSRSPPPITISLADARRHGRRPPPRSPHRALLKIKLGAPTGDPARIAAVRAAAPNATLIVDANEGWTRRQPRRQSRRLRRKPASR